MRPTANIRPAFYSLTTVAASIGVVFYWQINSYHQSFNNIAFIFTYILMLIFVSLPLFFSEMISSFLHKKLLTGSLRKVTYPKILYFLVIFLLLMLAFILLIVISSHISKIFSDFLYNIYWYTLESKSNFNITNYRTLIISITFSIIPIVFLGILQIFNNLVKLTLAFTTLGLISLIGLLILSALKYHDANIFTNFFIPDFHLLTLLDTWKAALILALFSGLIGTGIPSLLGIRFNSQCSVRYFNWVFLFTNVLITTIIMMICRLHISGIYTLGSIDLKHELLLNLFSFSTLFFYLLVNAIFLYQIFRYSSINEHLTPKKGNWYFQLPFLIILLTMVIIYQHVIGNKVREIIHSGLIINLILILSYIESIIFGWIFDAQKLSYKLQKVTLIKVSPIYNISIRLIAPSVILTMLVHKIFSTWINIEWYLIIIIFILTFIFTAIIGGFLNRKFQEQA